VNLEEWKNEELKRSREIICSLRDRTKRGEKISLLDFVPEYEKILRDKTYGLWRPPGDIQTMLQRPVANLASLLDRGMPVPSILLVPLNVHRSKAEFIECYGLVPEKGGPFYDVFIQEIREGRILPILTAIPTYYKGGFYQEILKACEEGEIKHLPPFSSYRIASFMREFSLSVSAIREGIPPEEGWKDLVLQKHPEYDIKSWVEKARSILSNEGARSDEGVPIIQKYPFTQDKENAASVVATRAYELSVFGFSDLANLSLEHFREPSLCFNVLDFYDTYLVSGYTEGSGGLRIYDKVDLEAMTFLRIIKNMQKRGLLRKRKPVIVAPASFSVVGTEIEIPVVMKFDEDDLRNSLKRERDKELERNMLEAMRAFQSYDFAKFREKNETINEIIEERIAKETGSYYRRSKIVEGTFVAGGTLTLAAGAIAVYQYLQPLLSLYSVFAGKAFDFMIKKREDVAKWLVSSWPFQQKGLPFYLWLHNIKPDKIQKALNA
jgi:hypothetical protein